MKKDTTRLIISFALIILFAFAFFKHPDNGLIVGALIASFTTAVNWWLGSSQGSADKSTIIENMGTGPSGYPGDPVHVEEERK